MKIKVDKKGKKRSLSENSLSTKPKQKQENITELKKSPKKAKLALVQNGNSTMENKVQILKKMYKQKEKQKAKKSINIGPLAKVKGEGENKLPITKLNEESATKIIKEKKFENLKKKQAKRALQKKKRNNAFRKSASITLSIEQIEAKIEEIRNREVLSKQAKKNLKVLNRKLKFEKLANKSEKLNIIEKKNNKKNKQQIGAIGKVSNEDNKDKIKMKKEHVQHEKIKIKREIDDQDDEDENDEDQSNSEKEEPMDIANEQFDDESDEDEDEEDEDAEDEDAEDDIDEKANILKGKKENVKKMKKQAINQKNQHFLYVYNLPLDVTEDELKQHFLTKVDAVSRIVINKSNIKKPPIVAYVWMTNSTDCKKGLSLHHTFLKNKRIIVKMKSNDNKNVGKDFGIRLPTNQHAAAKNKKPQAFQKAKKLASGNQGQKKSLKKEK
ncbi:hypothetical protein ACFW04_003785 [Cataglyphis niger]